MITPEMVNTLTTAANNGGSFANRDARSYHEKIVSRVLFALTTADIEAIRSEIAASR